MSEVDEFLAAMLPTIHEMDRAFINGDAGPRREIWSHDDPVTLFGALLTERGWDEVGPAFDFLASRFSNGTRYDYEVIGAGASGDLAYIVGNEHTMASVGGATPEAIDLRVTTILRRENGEWRIVHRHAGPIPGADATRRQITRF
jgi:ketosteroid isomerase-like protein